MLIAENFPFSFLNIRIEGPTFAMKSSNAHGTVFITASK